MKSKKSKSTPRTKLKAARILCQILFDIAARAFREEKVRQLRDEEIERRINEK